jgi:hypothetical protein
VDWVFNAAPVLKERAAWMALSEGLTYAFAPEQRAPYAQKSMMFIDRITDTLSKKMVRKVNNRWGNEIWPWDREGFKRSTSAQQSKAKPDYRYPFGFIFCQRHASRIISGRPCLGFQPSSHAALVGSA